jgi:leucine dehydrogenase
MLELNEITQTLASSHTVFERIVAGNHEQVVFCYDRPTELKAIISIHSTTLGPALGGTRMWPYATEEEALQDVLRLSRGMTYKAAVTGLNLGGGKAVIMGDPRKNKTEALFRRFGRFINNLAGQYITAEDVGTSTRDMEYIAQETKHVTGLPESMGGGGNPSPVTAYGVYMGMKAAAMHAWGGDSLKGKKIAVQGVGHVGENLVKLLREEGALVWVADIHPEQAARVAEAYGCRVIAPDAVYTADVDIYAPCALGATLNSENIDKLRCRVVAGAANNQLADESVHGRMLLERGILYAPDFLINAGGLINVYSEFTGYNREQALARTRRIYDVTLDILKKSARENISAHQAAMRIAEERLAAGRKGG